jgi:hypothetical protein
MLIEPLRGNQVVGFTMIRSEAKTVVETVVEIAHNGQS